ncbi:MAG: hypothetical protein R3D63_04490 [Paracoccaceae bacterium]
MRLLRYFQPPAPIPMANCPNATPLETHLLPLALRAARARAAVAGVRQRLPHPDGTRIRDYIHVADPPAPMWAGLQHLLGAATALAVNLGTGKGLSISRHPDRDRGAVRLARPVVWGPPRRRPARAGG